MIMRTFDDVGHSGELVRVYSDHDAFSTLKVEHARIYSNPERNPTEIRSFGCMSALVGDTFHAPSFLDSPGGTKFDVTDPQLLRIMEKWRQVERLAVHRLDWCLFCGAEPAGGDEAERQYHREAGCVGGDERFRR